MRDIKTPPLDQSVDGAVVSALLTKHSVHTISARFDELDPGSGSLAIALIGLEDTEVIRIEVPSVWTFYQDEEGLQDLAAWLLLHTLPRATDPSSFTLWLLRSGDLVNSVLVEGDWREKHRYEITLDGKTWKEIQPISEVTERTKPHVNEQIGEEEENG